MTMLPTTPAETQADLRTWRLLRGLSQRQLAEYLGVERKAVNRWESGVTSIPPYLYLALRQLEAELVQDAEDGS
jgi:transcriptional regulator with XRE-family HTH domain